MFITSQMLGRTTNLLIIYDFFYWKFVSYFKKSGQPEAHKTLAIEVQINM